MPKRLSQVTVLQNVTSSGALRTTDVAPTAPMCTQGRCISFMGRLPIGVVHIYNSLEPFTRILKTETPHPGSSTKQPRNQSYYDSQLAPWVRFKARAEQHLRGHSLQAHATSTTLLSILSPCNVETVPKSSANAVPQQREGRHSADHKGVTILYHTATPSHRQLRSRTVDVSRRGPIALNTTMFFHTQRWP